MRATVRLPGSVPSTEPKRVPTLSPPRSRPTLWKETEPWLVVGSMAYHVVPRATPMLFSSALAMGARCPPHGASAPALGAEPSGLDPGLGSWP